MIRCGDGVVLLADRTGQLVLRQIRPGSQGGRRSFFVSPYLVKRRAYFTELLSWRR